GQTSDLTTDPTDRQHRTRAGLATEHVHRLIQQIQGQRLGVVAAAGVGMQLHAQPLSDQSVEALEILGLAGAMEEVLVEGARHSLRKLPVLLRLGVGHVAMDPQNVVINEDLTTEDGHTEHPLGVPTERTVVVLVDVTELWLRQRNLYLDLDSVAFKRHDRQTPEDRDSGISAATTPLGRRLVLSLYASSRVKDPLGTHSLLVETHGLPSAPAAALLLREVRLQVPERVVHRRKLRPQSRPLP